MRSTMLLASIALAAFPAAAADLPFIEDDYPQALKKARTANVPIFIDAWAPW